MLAARGQWWRAFEPAAAVAHAVADRAAGAGLDLSTPAAGEVPSAGCRVPDAAGDGWALGVELGGEA